MEIFLEPTAAIRAVGNRVPRWYRHPKCISPAHHKISDSLFHFSGLLIDFNRKNSNSFGLTIDDQDVVRTLIDTLGFKKDMNGYEALLDSKYSNYTPGIIKQADKALKMLDA